MEFKKDNEVKPEKKFKPKRGQTDFTNARWAPVVNCVVRHKSKILLVKRNSGMRLYPGYWNGVSGFLDDQRSLEQKVKDELREELGISEKAVTAIQLGAIFDQDAPEYKKTWVVHPVLVDVSTDAIKLDWEAEEYAWVSPQQVRQYNLVPGFDGLIEMLLRGGKRVGNLL